MIRLLALMAMMAAHVWGETQDRASLPRDLLQYRVRLGNHVGQCSDAGSLVFKSPNVGIVVSQDSISFTGVDRSGLAWRVSGDRPGDMGCRLWQYDLDRDGRKDYVLAFANGGSGLKGVSLTIVTFDAGLRPLAWQATGAYTFVDDEPANFVDLDQDGRAELLYQHTEEIPLSDDRPSSIALYRLGEHGFIRYEGKFGGQRFPFVAPASAKFDEEPDLSMPSPASRRHRPLQPAVTRGSAGPCWSRGLAIENEGVVLTRTPSGRWDCEGYLTSDKVDRIAIPFMVVVESKNGRFIELNGAGDLLERVVRGRWPFRLSGRICETGCRAFVLWADSDTLIPF